MTRTFKIIMEYDGAGFHGWQRQADVRTVQGDLEAALGRITNQKVTVIGSGRTDAGVHARGQVACFRCDVRLTPEVLQRALNGVLKEDVVVTDCVRAPDAFHARFDARSKTYRYVILNRPLPAAIGRQYAWFIRTPLDLRAMQDAAAFIRGTHDFKAFEGAGSPRAHTVRHVFHADWLEKEDGYVVFEIEADGFLRYMVRNIVGALVETGLGKTTPAAFNAVLEGRDRTLAGPAAPAHGLRLIKVNY